MHRLCDFLVVAARGNDKARKTKMKVKASGGIRTLADARAMVAAGAERLGVSAGVAIMKELVAEEEDDGGEGGEVDVRAGGGAFGGGGGDVY